MAVPMTLFDKIWPSHAILARPDGAMLLISIAISSTMARATPSDAEGEGVGSEAALPHLRRTITSRRSAMISLRSMSRTAGGLSKFWEQTPRPQA
jgi:hypothetical protein